MEDRMESLTRKKSQVRVLFRPLKKPPHTGVSPLIMSIDGGVTILF